MSKKDNIEVEYWKIEDQLDAHSDLLNSGWEFVRN
jgi:hypothetical protein